MRSYGMLIENVCPIRRAKLKGGTQTTERVTFSLKAYPNWKLTYFDRDLHQLSLIDDEFGDLWLNRPILQLLNNNPQGVEQSVLLLESEQGEKIAISAQELVFNANQHIRQSAEDNEINSRYAIRNRLAKWLSFRVLTLGQFMVSGLHGLKYEGLLADTNPVEIADLIHAAALELSQKLKTYHAILLKDLSPMDSEMAARWQELGYYVTPVDPSMKLTIHKDWKQFDDYLLDISSKYRVRYRRTQKKLPENLSVQTLGLADCHKYAAQMHQLYLNVKLEAAFDAIDLDACYFVSLKKTLKERLTIKGYFLADKLIGFTTAIDNGAVMHAHYLGFDRELNRSVHLYHNMLFDLLKQGIDEGYEVLDYGRTALEIKSSLGAKPKDYFCGIYATKPIYNWIVSILAPAVFKSPTWVERNPLKAR